MIGAKILETIPLSNGYLLQRSLNEDGTAISKILNKEEHMIMSAPTNQSRTVNERNMVKKFNEMLKEGKL